MKMLRLLSWLAFSVVLIGAPKNGNAQDGTLVDEVTILVSGLSGGWQAPNEHNSFVRSALQRLGEPVVPILVKALQAPAEDTGRTNIQPSDAAGGLIMLGSLATNQISSVVEAILTSEHWLHASRVFANVGTNHLLLLKPALASQKAESVERTLHCLELCGRNALELEAELIALVGSSNLEISRRALGTIQKTEVHSVALEAAVYRVLFDESPFRVRAALRCVQNWAKVNAHTFSKLQDLSESANPEVRAQAKAILARMRNDCSLPMVELLSGGFEYGGHSGNVQHDFAIRCLTGNANASVPMLVAQVLAADSDEPTAVIARNRAVRALVGMGPAATNALPELAHAITKLPSHASWQRAGTVFAGIGKDHLELLKNSLGPRDSDSVLHVLWVLAISGPNTRSAILEGEIVEALRSQNDQVRHTALKAVASCGVQTQRIEDAVCDAFEGDRLELISEALRCISNWKMISESNRQRLSASKNSAAWSVSRQAISHLRRFALGQPRLTN